jgi:predicted cation transporter
MAGLMPQIAPHPVLGIVVGLSAIALSVLSLPFLIKKIEENLEPFFLLMGLLAVTISGLWHRDLILAALRAPVMIRNLPLGIFQVVLVVGLFVHYYNEAFTRVILKVAHRLGAPLFIFLLIALFGLLSSVISVILAACVLAEIAASLPMTRENRVRLIIVACFAVGLGAVLTPLGEPLSTILVAKLTGPPYNAGFFFPVKHFGIYLVSGVGVLALFGALWLGPRIPLRTEGHVHEYNETLKSVVLRAVKVYIFVAALVLLGEGFKPMIVWYVSRIAPPALYWFNSLSAVLDNATLTAMESGPAMALPQIVGIVMGLSIAGGMLIPGNIPNIVAAARLKIRMKDWARLGLPLGLIIMAVYFLILFEL